MSSHVLCCIVFRISGFPSLKSSAPKQALSGDRTQTLSLRETDATIKHQKGKRGRIRYLQWTRYTDRCSRLSYPIVRKKGFEPLVTVTRHGSLSGCYFKPLSHLRNNCLSHSPTLRTNGFPVAFRINDFIFIKFNGCLLNIVPINFVQIHISHRFFSAEICDNHASKSST